MSGKDRRLYLTATTLDQALLDWCADNLETQLQIVVDIDAPVGKIYTSDANMNIVTAGVGVFYEALSVQPVISRTVGEWLSPELQFSTLTIEVSNVDGRFNKFLPAGANFSSFVGKTVLVKLGLAEIGSTYTTIFAGKITDIGGSKRSVKSVTFIARDQYDTLNVSFPKNVLSVLTYPKIQDSVAGKFLPVIYGDFTVALDPSPAIVPTMLLNGNDPFLSFAEKDVGISISSPAVLTATNHGLDDGELIQFNTTGTLPTGVSTGTDYYVRNSTLNQFNISLTPSGSLVATSGTQSGSHTFLPGSTALRKNAQYIISDNDLLSLDTDNIWLLRGEVYFKAPASEIVGVGAGNKTFQVKQNTVFLWVDGAAFLFESSDTFWVRCKGKDLGAYSDNIVEQARDILKTYGGALVGDFDANWDTYRDKATPAQSAIVNIKSRVWRQDQSPTMTFALSMLEQVRLEAFIDRTLKIKINSLHFEDFQSAPTYTVKNWDVVQGTFSPQLDDKNNFNRAQGAYDFHPDTNEDSRATPVFRNDASITQIGGKLISKRISFPNLYISTDADNQLKEILRLASAFLEHIVVNLTWRATLLDIGDFVKVDVKIGSSVFDNVPAMIRDIGYDPKGLQIPVRLWSFQLVPFPGYTPGYAGTVGGYAATITQE